jgi:hypothetical protein
MKTKKSFLFVSKFVAYTKNKTLLMFLSNKTKNIARKMFNIKGLSSLILSPY